jgi:hypothetical protein
VTNTNRAVSVLTDIAVTERPSCTPVDGWVRCPKPARTAGHVGVMSTRAEPTDAVTCRTLPKDNRAGHHV